MLEFILSKSIILFKKLKKEKKGWIFNNFCFRKEVFICDGGWCLWLKFFFILDWF